MINLLHNHKPTSCRCNIEVTLKQVVASVVRNRDFYQKWPSGQSKGKRSWTLLNLSSGLFVYSSVALCNSVSWFIHANMGAQSRVIEGSCKQINLTSVRPPARYFCSVKHSQWIHHALSKRQWLLCEKLSFHTRRDLNTKLWWSQHGWSLMRNRSGQAIHQGVMVKYDSLSQRIKCHVPWHLIQTQEVTLSICMRHTGLQTPSNTNPSALIRDNHWNCTMRRSFQIEKVGGVELEWRVTHNFYPGDQSLHPARNQMSQIFSLTT